MNEPLTIGALRVIIADLPDDWHVVLTDPDTLWQLNVRIIADPDEKVLDIQSDYGMRR